MQWKDPLCNGPSFRSQRAGTCFGHGGGLPHFEFLSSKSVDLMFSFWRSLRFRTNRFPCSRNISSLCCHCSLEIAFSLLWLQVARPCQRNFRCRSWFFAQSILMADADRRRSGTGFVMITNCPQGYGPRVLNGGFQAVVSGWSGEQILAPHFNLNVTSNSLRAQRLKKINPAWNFQSRSKNSISLHNFNPDLQNSPQKTGVWWVARLKSQSRLKISIPEDDLDFFSIFGPLRVQEPRKGFLAKGFLFAVSSVMHSKTKAPKDTRPPVL